MYTQSRSVFPIVTSHRKGFFNIHDYGADLGIGGNGCLFLTLAASILFPGQKNLSREQFTEVQFLALWLKNILVGPEAGLYYEGTSREIKLFSIIFGIKVNVFHYTAEGVSIEPSSDSDEKIVDLDGYSRVNIDSLVEKNNASLPEINIGHNGRHFVGLSFKPGHGTDPSPLKIRDAKNNPISHFPSQKPNAWNNSSPAFRDARKGKNNIPRTPFSPKTQTPSSQFLSTQSGYGWRYKVKLIITKDSDCTIKYRREVVWVDGCKYVFTENSVESIGSRSYSSEGLRHPSFDLAHILPM